MPKKYSNRARKCLRGFWEKTIFSLKSFKGRFRQFLTSKHLLRATYILKPLTRNCKTFRKRTLPYTLKISNTSSNNYSLLVQSKIRVRHSSKTAMLIKIIKILTIQAVLTMEPQMRIKICNLQQLLSIINSIIQLSV
jgi:hypothetical protein